LPDPKDRLGRKAIPALKVPLVPLDLPGLPDLKDRLGLRVPRQTPNRKFSEAA
jgi:hypothetical protein